MLRIAPVSFSRATLSVTRRGAQKSRLMPSRPGTRKFFVSSRISVFQALLAKPDAAGVVPLPWSRADI